MPWLLGGQSGCSNKLKSQKLANCQLSKFELLEAQLLSKFIRFLNFGQLSEFEVLKTQFLSGSIQFLNFGQSQEHHSLNGRF